MQEISITGKGATEKHKLIEEIFWKKVLIKDRNYMIHVRDKNVLIFPFLKTTWQIKFINYLYISCYTQCSQSRWDNLSSTYHKTYTDNAAELTLTRCLQYLPFFFYLLTPFTYFLLQPLISGNHQNLFSIYLNLFFGLLFFRFHI